MKQTNHIGSRSGENFNRATVPVSMVALRTCRCVVWTFHFVTERERERKRVSFHYANEISIMIMHPIGLRDIIVVRQG